MPGGLLNIISYGNQNIILNGNPSKTFFKTVYSKYSNFGIQKFQIDYTGLRNLQLNELVVDWANNTKDKSLKNILLATTTKSTLLLHRIYFKI